MRCWLFHILVCVTTGLLAGRLDAQPVRDTLDAAGTVGRALEQTDAESGVQDLAEWLADRAMAPLSLNAASLDALARLPGITPLLAQRIIARRQTEGPFTALDDLTAIPGVDAELVRRLRPFLTLHPPSAPDDVPARRALSGRLIQRLTRRLDLGPGYTADTTRTTYAGSPERIYTRLQLRQPSRFGFNLTLEKDPGEAFRWRPATRTYGFDHLSTHLVIHDLGPIEQFILGDFSAAFGQGLSLWRSFSFAKGRDVIGTAVRRGTGLSPYSSTEENRFFRGSGLTVRLAPSLQLSVFGSQRRLDATTALNDRQEPVITRLATSGLHRTPTERAQKDAAREQLAGAALTWSADGTQLGLTGYRGWFDTPLAPMDAPHRRFDPTGRRHMAVSAHGQATWRDLFVFGELARTQTTWGAVGGLQISTEWAEAVMSIRHYPRSFAPQHGRAFGELGDRPQNEFGLYTGVRVQPAARWQVSGYVDQYRFPWLRFATPRPSTGYDTRLIVEHSPRRWLTYYVQVRTETREEGHHLSTPERTIHALRPTTRQSIRLHGEYVFSPQLRYRTRWEGARYRSGPTTHTGMLLYQGIRWQPSTRFRLDTRWTLFDTEGFDARLYAYEYDLLYAFSIPVFSGRGSRHYALISVRAVPGLHLEAKYSVTRYRDRDTVGSGLDAIEGTRLRDLRVQVRWRF